MMEVFTLILSRPWGLHLSECITNKQCFQDFQWANLAE